MLDNHSRAYATAIGGDEYYFLISNEKIAVVDVGDNKNYKVFYWETPEGINIESGFYFAGNFWFLCTASVRGLVYVAHLEGKNDSIMYISDDKILKSEVPISCGFTTKQYNFGDARNNKNIEGVYLNLSAAKKVSIEINDIYKTEVNFGFLNEDYDKCEHKSVRLSPHIRNSCGVKFTFAANGDMSLGDIEIQYRVTG